MCVGNASPSDDVDSRSTVRSGGHCGSVYPLLMLDPYLPLLALEALLYDAMVWIRQQVCHLYLLLPHVH